MCEVWNESTQPFLNLKGVSECMLWQQFKKSFDTQHQIQHLKFFVNI